MNRSTHLLLVGLRVEQLLCSDGKHISGTARESSEEPPSTRVQLSLLICDALLPCTLLVFVVSTRSSKCSSTHHIANVLQRPTVPSYTIQYLRNGCSHHKERRAARAPAPTQYLLACRRLFMTLGNTAREKKITSCNTPQSSSTINYNKCACIACGVWNRIWPEEMGEKRK